MWAPLHCPSVLPDTCSNTDSQWAAVSFTLYQPAVGLSTPKTAVGICTPLWFSSHLHGTRSTMMNFICLQSKYFILFEKFCDIQQPGARCRLIGLMAALTKLPSLNAKPLKWLRTPKHGQYELILLPFNLIWCLIILIFWKLHLVHGLIFDFKHKTIDHPHILSELSKNTQSGQGDFLKHT